MACSPPTGLPKLPLDQLHAITARPSAAVPGEIITAIQSAAETPTT